MLLTIHNLPARTEYSDVKDLILSKCGLEDSIVDNLQNEGSGMRVTVGVAEEEDAAILVRKINGLYYRGQQLYVEDKRPQKESEQPYRTTIPQKPQYMEMQPPAQQGFDFNPHLQAAMNIYQPAPDYGGYQPRPPGQTGVQNTYMAYGGQQMQPQQFLSQYAGASNEYIQQPYVPLVQQNLELAGGYNQRSPSPRRHWSTEGGRSGRDDRLHSSSPPAFAPWASSGRDEPSELSGYQDPPSVRNERPDNSSGFSQPKDMYEKRGLRQYDDSHGFNASNSRGGHFSNIRDKRDGHSANSRDSRGGHSSTSRYMRDGHYSTSQDMNDGHTANLHDIRGGDSTTSWNMSGVHSSNTRDMSGGLSSMSRDMRSGHSTSQDMRGGHTTMSRGVRGGHSSTSQNMRGGHTEKSRDMRSGHSFSSQDMRGGHTVMSRGVRGGHSSTSQNMRGGHTEKSRDMRSGHSFTSQDMRGGHTVMSRGMRGGHSSTSQNMRGGHTEKSRDMRGGNAPHAHESRGEPSPNPREMRGGHYPDMRDNRPKNAQKRRWEESTDKFKQPAQDNWLEQPTTKRESRRKKIATQPPQKLKGNNPGIVSKPQGNEPPNFTFKELKLSQVKAVGKLMFNIAKHLDILPEFEGPSLVKCELRKILTGRVNDELTGREILTPKEITTRYRERYPESDDFDVYNSIMRKLSGTEPEETKEGPGPAFAPAPKMKKTALKNQPRPVSPGKIPSYTQGNKKIHSQIKKQHTKDMATLESCTVNPTFQRAMDEEAEAIGALLKKEFNNLLSQEEGIENIFSKKEQEECIILCKKLVVYHISRRITNSGPKLIRIFGHPKPPKRTDLEAFLSRYRCLSLKKSAKCAFFTATVNSYDTVDELCNMQPIIIGDQNILVTFKHMHVAPKKQRLDQKLAKRLRKKYVSTLIENSKVNLLDKDWQTVEEEERKPKAVNDVISVDNQEKTEILITNDKEVEPENQNPAKKRKISEAVASEDKSDFLHVDFKVIDEVRESDNDEVPTGALNKESNTEEGGNEIKGDWDENGEDWDDIGDEENVTNAVKDDNDTRAVEDEINNSENVGDNAVADLDWDDVNEDDLEDY